MTIPAEHERICDILDAAVSNWTGNWREDVFHIEGLGIVYTLSLRCIMNPPKTWFGRTIAYLCGIPTWTALMKEKKCYTMYTGNEHFMYTRKKSGDLTPILDQWTYEEDYS